MAVALGVGVAVAVGVADADDVADAVGIAVGQEVAVWRGEATSATWSASVAVPVAAGEIACVVMPPPAGSRPRTSRMSINSRMAPAAKRSERLCIGNVIKK